MSATLTRFCIEFGMDDVKADFDRKMTHTKYQIKDVVSSGMNQLMGAYLRNVIQGSYEDVDPANFSLLDETTVDSILSRIDETVLPEAALPQLE